MLVVDDENSLADLLSMALRYAGWDVKAAPDGHTTPSLAQELKPDAIVLDVLLPDINGLPLLGRRRHLDPVPRDQGRGRGPHHGPDGRWR